MAHIGRMSAVHSFSQRMIVVVVSSLESESSPVSGMEYCPVARMVIDFTYESSVSTAPFARDRGLWLFTIIFNSDRACKWCYCG